MTVYQELQLSAAGSKQLIRNASDKKQKRRHILIYNFKVYLLMAFCVLVVALFTKILGSDNSVAGIAILLSILVLRQADFGIKTSHGLICIMGICGILIVGPRLANALPAVPACGLNLVCILLLMILGCHNVIMYNHSTFVLSYLLLVGYDVTGEAYVTRVIGLLVGMGISMAVFYKNQRKRLHRRTFGALFREFNLRSQRGRWYIKLTIIVSSAMLIITLLDLPRAMWAGIACMSVCLPFTADAKKRSPKRGAYNIIGCLLFAGLYVILPKGLRTYIGMIGGVGVGYSATYEWQTVFNTFGALVIAAGMFGLKEAVFLRVGINVLCSIYTIVCCVILDKIMNVAFSRSELQAC